MFTTVKALTGAALGALVLAGSAATAQAAGTVTRTYDAPATEGTFLVPAGVESIQVLAVGGAGGSSFSAIGGQGARVSSELSVTPGSTLYVEVGREGAKARNGAGEGGLSSDVRTRPRADGLSPDDRLIVAGAGGGGGEEGRRLEGAAGDGGNAGGDEGQEGEGFDGLEGGGGGTQTSGGFPGEEYGRAEECLNPPLYATGGKLETGGYGESCRSHAEGGWGGAGFYGGGGGGAGLYSGAGGGGGSSLVPAGGSVSLAKGAAPQVQISYTQPPNPPAVITGSAGDVEEATATLNATVDPEDEEVSSCLVEYGTSEAYGYSVPCSTAPGSGIEAVAVSASVSGLSPVTTYHYRIVATNAQGTSYGSDATFTTQLHNAPTVTAVSPEAGPLAGGTSVTISGTELAEATVVMFGSKAASIASDSEESITVLDPAGVGTVSVSVTTPYGTSKAASADQFTYLAVPVASAVTPAGGPSAGGTTVHITGSGFERVSAVRFGATAATEFNVEGTGTITAVSPAGVGTASVTVTTPGGTSASAPGSQFGYESGAPEFGRCVKVPANDASFVSSSCTQAGSTTKGEAYRWEPGVEKAAFTASSSGAAKFETASKAKLTCASATLTGEIVGSTGVGDVAIRFKGCEASGKACTTAGLAAGEIGSSMLEGALGWEKIAQKKVALDLYPEGHAGAFLQYTCSGEAATSVTGSVLIPVKPNKMATTSKLKLKASKGKQKPEAFEGGERDVLSSSIGGGAAVQTGLTLSLTQANEEAVEINSAV